MTTITTFATTTIEITFNQSLGIFQVKENGKVFATVSGKNTPAVAKHIERETGLGNTIVLNVLKENGEIVPVETF